MGMTLCEKIWAGSRVERVQGGDLLYIDLHLVHELGPQAFSGLKDRGMRVRRPDLTVATMDHNVPTSNRNLPIEDPLAAAQLQALRDNCAEYGIPLFGLGAREQGIVHIIGPERGLTLPGLVIACGDSHTATHGALGALAFGIGTSQVEHVLAMQTLILLPSKQMRVSINGKLGAGVTAKDMALAFIHRVGFAGARGYIVEYQGEAVEALSVEGRMTLCNMSAESGARAGIIAPDTKTIEYVKGREYAPKGDEWDVAVREWGLLHSDSDAFFDVSIEIDASAIQPTVTWGTTPAMSAAIDGKVPTPAETADPAQTQRALDYMGLQAGTRITDIAIDRVFIGSCTNSRIEDLRAAAAIVHGKKVHPDVRAMVVPGSIPVKLQAELEGLDVVFKDAGIDWRQPGCSMCLGMNPDVLAAGERCASTSNRNFEGRQGAGGRTHLVSPAMAAAAAIAGHFVDFREGPDEAV